LVNTRQKLLFISGALLGVYVIAAVTYVIAENHSFGDSLWWAFMTFTTVGYGDQYPMTIAGRLAGAALVFTAVFVAVPTITAIVSSRIMGNEHEFTHEEQEEVKFLLRRIDGNLRELRDNSHELDNRVSGLELAGRRENEVINHFSGGATWEEIFETSYKDVFSD